MLSWIECKDSEKFRISKENTDKSALMSHKVITPCQWTLYDFLYQILLRNFYFQRHDVNIFNVSNE